MVSQEDYKALEMQIHTPDAPVEAEEVETSEEAQASKSQVKHKAKGRKKTVRFAETLQETTNQSKSSRGKHTDGQTSVKDNHANKKASETLKAKQKSGAAAERPAKSVKAARGPQKRVETESNPQESEQAARGRRKPPGSAQAAASQARNRSKVKSEAAPSGSSQKSAGEEAQNSGLRRSKRIASKK